MVKNQAIEANACYHRRQADRNISHRCKDRWQVISSAQGQSCSPAESATRKNASSAVNINNMAGRALAVCLALFFAHAAYGWVALATRTRSGEGLCQIHTSMHESGHHRVNTLSVFSLHQANHRARLWSREL